LYYRFLFCFFGLNVRGSSFLPLFQCNGSSSLLMSFRDWLWTNSWSRCFLSLKMFGRNKTFFGSISNSLVATFPTFYESKYFASLSWLW
jgi:hypothetical protein